MAWAKLTSATNENLGAIATKTVTSAVALAVGDLVRLAVTYDFSAPATGSVVTDSLGNTYTRTQLVEDVPRTQRLEKWMTVVTNAGTPTVQIQFLPVPGTTAAGNLSLNLDPFTGSDASSTADGTGAAQLQATPGTGTDGVTSGAFTTSVNGDLIDAATCSPEGGADPGAVGTGFTLGIASTGNPILRTEYKTQSSAGSVAGTFTAATNVAHLTACDAVKPAGAAAPDSPPLRDLAHSPQYQTIISQ